MLSNRLFTVLAFTLAGLVVSQDQPFSLNFEDSQFQTGQITGRINDPVQQFDLSDFTVIEAQNLPEKSVPAASLKTSLLRPCTSSHYISRISPNFQDRVTDRGKTVGIKIAKGLDGQPLFRSFDLGSICMGCIFVPAITQGSSLIDLIPSDPLTQMVLPASCEITLTGTKYITPQSNEKTTITTTVKFEANPPLDIAKATTLRATDMMIYSFNDNWKNLESIQFKIQKVKVNLPVGLPAQFDPILSTTTLIDSLALDNFNGTKHAST
ncbi:hypothetical protein TWF730_003014 [Orbilia blumenaviensis]|uniref:Uncharacterized protein n=1 Tax=Orbilia blumenaviensis TaxID=1796055 RepID=A0AAV9UBB0_9PEZI